MGGVLPPGQAEQLRWYLHWPGEKGFAGGDPHLCKGQALPSVMGGGGGKNGARRVFVIISEAGAGGRMFALWFEFLPGQGAGRWSRGGRG